MPILGPGNTKLLWMMVDARSPLKGSWNDRCEKQSPTILHGEKNTSQNAQAAGPSHGHIYGNRVHSLSFLGLVPKPRQTAALN